MDELIEAVKALAREEYERAAKKFGGYYEAQTRRKRDGFEAT